MRILIILSKWKGGVGSVIKNITKEFKYKGHQVRTISREDDLNCKSFMNSFKILNKEVNKYDYDILFTQDWSISLPLIFKNNHISYFHGLSDGKISKYLQLLTGRLLGKRLCVVGNGVKNIFPKSNLIYNGIDDKRFYNLNKERKYIGWIKRDYDLINMKQAQKIAKENNLELSIAENIPFDEMNEWYNSLRTFISYPPSYTGFNLGWGEALLAGVLEVKGNENGIGITNTKNNIKKLTVENQVNKLLEAMENYA